MSTTRSSAGRGRPPTITRERITDAAIAMGLPSVTVLGVAAELGVSAKALYKHCAGLEELKRLAAEEIFIRWRLPEFLHGEEESLESYMLRFSSSMWDLVEKHTGIAPYMLRRELVTPAMMEKMAAHQTGMAQAFGMSFAQANWLLFTVAYYSVSVADTVLPLSGAAATEAARAAIAVTHPVETDAAYEERVRTLYALGSKALITGSLTLLQGMGK